MRENWERGTEVLPLSPEEASLLLQPILPSCHVTQVVPTEDGKANTNLRVELAGGERLLLRLFVRDPESGAKEAALLRRLAGHIPVPALHYFNSDNPVTGHPYAVLEWIEGPSLERALAASDLHEAASLAREAGRVLAALGRETFPQAGFLAPDLTISMPYEPGSAGFLRLVEEMSTAPSAAARLGPDLQQRFLAFCRAEATLLDDLDPQARLVHCDFDPSNILLTRLGESWRLAAVIDWEFAIAGPPLIDLGHLLRAPQGDIPGFAEALAAGYREAGGELPGEWRAAAKLLDLPAWLDFLNRPGDHPRLFADARRMIEDTLARWPEIHA